MSRPASAPATARAYRADWAHFAAWCAETGRQAAPATPDTLAAYLASMATTHAPSTMRRRLAAIARVHRFNDLPWTPVPLAPVSHPAAQPRLEMSPAIFEQLLETCDQSPRGRRDRALLLFARAGGLRRAELVGLRVEGVEETAEGLRLTLPRAGGGEGRAVDLGRGQQAASCPVAAFHAWQAVARRSGGPLFRPISKSGRVGAPALNADAVRRILAYRLALAGDETSFSPDALRAVGAAKPMRP